MVAPALVFDTFKRVAVSCDQGRFMRGNVMWDKAFTASMVAYGISTAPFLLGHFLLPILFPDGSPVPQAVTLVGAVLLGIAGIFMGVSALGLLLSLLPKIRAHG